MAEVRGSGLGSVTVSGPWNTDKQTLNRPSSCVTMIFSYFKNIWFELELRELSEIH